MNLHNKFFYLIVIVLTLNPISASERKGVIQTIQGWFGGSSNNGQQATTTGVFSDAGKFAGTDAVQKVGEILKDPATKILTDDIAKNAGSTAIKGIAEILSAPATKALTDDVGKNVGSTAATALANAAVTSTGIVAGVAVAGATLYVADKAVDRFFPLPQEQANREEATTRVLQAKTNNVRETETLEDIQYEVAFTRCLRMHPKQIRNTHGCPGHCQNLYRALVLAGKRQAANQKLADLHSLDEEPVLQMSAEEAEKQVRVSFASNKGKDVPMEKSYIPCGLIGFLGFNVAEYELPRESVDLLHTVAPLSPKRFSRVLADGIEEHNPHVRAHPCLTICCRCGGPCVLVEKR